jgi:galactoside O-acetyltransferase
MDSFLSQEELENLGLRGLGKNVLISRNAKLYSPGKMTFGSNVRIDDFCILSGEVQLDDYIHIGAGGYFFAGEAGIEIHSFSTTSSRVVIYAVSDDYSGRSMTNPLIPEKYKFLQKERVIVGRHVIIGTGTVILPGVVIGDGCSVGAMSLVKQSLPQWTISHGVPAKPVKPRKKDLLEQEKRFLDELRN